MAAPSSLSLELGLGPPDRGVSLQPQPHDRPPPDGDSTKPVSSFVSPWLRAPFPLTLDEHLPAASLVGHTAFRHSASYMTRFRRRKVGQARVELTTSFNLACCKHTDGQRSEMIPTRRSTTCNDLGISRRQQLSSLRVCSLSSWARHLPLSDLPEFVEEASLGH